MQRIAVCYLLASIIFLKTSVRTQVVIVVALLLVYWLLMASLSAPGFASGDLSKCSVLPVAYTQLTLPSL